MGRRIDSLIPSGVRNFLRRLLTDARGITVDFIGDLTPSMTGKDRDRTG